MGDYMVTSRSAQMSAGAQPYLGKHAVSPSDKVVWLSSGQSDAASFRYKVTMACLMVRSARVHGRSREIKACCTSGEVRRVIEALLGVDNHQRGEPENESELHWFTMEQRAYEILRVRRKDQL